MRARVSSLIICLLSIVLIASCGPSEKSFVSRTSPLVFDVEDLSENSKIAVFVPGALASIDIFDDATFWADEGYALVYYRFPGLDGLPTDHALGISSAGQQIAKFLNEYPEHEITLVGYSTGGPIALSAARLLSRDRQISIALIAPAPERAGGLETRLRGLSDIAAAATRAQSLDRDTVWPVYWQTLLFGRDNLHDPEFSSRIETLFASEVEAIVVPSAELVDLHSSDLQTWDLPPDLSLEGIEVAMFVGDADPVFSLGQSMGLARQIGLEQIYAYADDGHLLFLTRDSLFADILNFAQSAFEQD